MTHMSVWNDLETLFITMMIEIHESSIILFNTTSKYYSTRYIESVYWFDTIVTIV